MTDERFLVTGALGCVGSWVLKRLIDDGADVWAFDLPGEPHRLRLLMDEPTVAGVQQLVGDITDPDCVQRAIAEHRITHVVHLAALQVPFVRADPVRGAAVNVVGTTAVFEAVRRHREQVRGLAYASSAAVYGADPDGARQDPVAGAGWPATLYGAFKRANEATAQVYWADHGIRSIGLRPSVVYGPGRDQGASSPPSKALLAAAAGRRYHVGLATPLQLQYTDDVADAFIRAARLCPPGARTADLGGPVVAMPDLVELIESVVPESAGLITTEPATQTPTSIAGPGLDDVLGLAVPVTPLAEGVRRSIELFRAARDRGLLDIDRILEAVSTPTPEGGRA
jgi:UDP-glucuronate 4-epimerase